MLQSAHPSLAGVNSVGGSYQKRNWNVTGIACSLLALSKLILNWPIKFELTKRISLENETEGRLSTALISQNCKTWEYWLQNVMTCNSILQLRLNLKLDFNQLFCIISIHQSDSGWLHYPHLLTNKVLNSSTVSFPLRRYSLALGEFSLLFCHLSFLFAGWPQQKKQNNRTYLLLLPNK